MAGEFLRVGRKNTQEFTKRLCQVLGIEHQNLKKLVLIADSNQVITVEVTRYCDEDDLKRIKDLNIEDFTKTVLIVEKQNG